MSAPQWMPGDEVSLDASTHWTGLDGGRAAARIAAFLREIEDKWGGAHAHLTADNGGRDTLQWLAEEFEAVSKDPKPEEPQGLGAVVEDAEGKRWIRVDWTNPWCIAKPHQREPHQRGLGSASHDSHVRWDRLNAVRVLSAGWSE